MTETERQILEGIARDTASVQATVVPPAGMNAAARGRAIMRRRDLETIGVPIEYARWMGVGSLSAAGRQAARRAALKLQEAGLVALAAAWGDKITHAKLTPAGEEKAHSLLATNQDHRETKP
jgi:hypothetical protein